MKTDKELGAMRVIEALSAVDEELLERSGKTAENRKNSMNVRRFVKKYTAACAACLCLMLLGAAYFGVSRIRMGSASESSKGMNMNGGAAFQDTDTDGAAPEEVPEGAEAEAAGNAFSDEGMSVLAEPEWLDVEQLAALPAAVQETAETETIREDLREENEKNNELQQSADKSADADNAAVQGTPAIEPGAEAAVPERYSPVEMGIGSGDQGSLLYEWTDGEHGLWLRITQTELTVNLRFDMEPPVYTVQEEWRDMIPDAGADGYVQFALLYENGMLAEYRGTLERAEIIELLESLAW